MIIEPNERIDQLSEKIYQQTATLKDMKEFNQLLDKLLKDTNNFFQNDRRK